MWRRLCAPSGWMSPQRHSLISQVHPPPRRAQLCPFSARTHLCPSPHPSLPFAAPIFASPHTPTCPPPHPSACPPPRVANLPVVTRPAHIHTAPFTPPHSHRPIHTAPLIQTPIPMATAPSASRSSAPSSPHSIRCVQSPHISPCLPRSPAFSHFCTLVTALDQEKKSAAGGRGPSAAGEAGGASSLTPAELMEAKVIFTKYTLLPHLPPRPTFLLAPPSSSPHLPPRPSLTTRPIPTTRADAHAHRPLLCNRYDRDRNGYMSSRELVPALKELHLPTDTSSAVSILHQFDKARALPLSPPRGDPTHARPLTPLTTTTSPPRLPRVLPARLGCHVSRIRTGVWTCPSLPSFSARSVASKASTRHRPPHLSGPPSARMTPAALSNLPPLVCPPHLTAFGDTWQV